MLHYKFVIAPTFVCVLSTQVLISAIIVTACRTTRTEITASSEVNELLLLVVVSRGVEYVSVNSSDRCFSIHAQLIYLLN